MKTFYILSILLGLVACGEPYALDHTSLMQHQPKVIGVDPAAEDSVAWPPQIRFTFSSPVDPTTVTSQTVAVVPVTDPKLDAGKLLDTIAQGNTVPVAGDYQLNTEKDQVTITPDVPQTAGTYAVVVTPQVTSPEKIPFNQTPGEAPTPYVTFFSVADTSLSTAADPPTGDTNVAADSAAPPPTPSGATTAAPHPPVNLSLSEIYYDAAGVDTNGDLFVELYGSPQASIADYKINFINGDDGKIVDTLKLPKEAVVRENGFFVAADAITGQAGKTHVANADWVINFDLQNGPDCVQLISPSGAFVDAVGYGDSMVVNAENNLKCFETAPASDVAAGLSLARDLSRGDTHDNSKDWKPNTVPSPGTDTITIAK